MKAKQQRNRVYPSLTDEMLADLRELVDCENELRRTRGDTDRVNIAGLFCDLGMAAVRRRLAQVRKKLDLAA